MMDVERSTLLNCVVNFLLEENYLLTAFELFHELMEDGRESVATRLQEYFSDTATFPPDQISKLHRSRVVDPQTLLKEKETAEERVAIAEYELRLAREDISQLKTELERRTLAQLNGGSNDQSETRIQARNASCETSETGKKFSSLGPLKEDERRALNCAVKEFLISAGYKLTAMTFYEEVSDQNLDVWENEAACVPDALRRYYIQYMSSSIEAAEEKIAMIRDKESLMIENESLLKEKESLIKSRDRAETQISLLGRSLEAVQKDAKEKDKQIQTLKDALERATKELNECRAEITSLKLQLDGSRAAMKRDNTASLQACYDDKIAGYESEIQKLQSEIKSLKDSTPSVRTSEEIVDHSTDDKHSKIKVDEMTGPTFDSPKETLLASQESVIETLKGSEESCVTSKTGFTSAEDNTDADNNQLNHEGLDMVVQSTEDVPSASTGLTTVQVLADALPKIAPYVLINHREELLPLIMCTIERHPDSSTRDALTHTLFNLIKRPDEQQRRIIMDACVNLAKNVGDMRTETELLPQCWEQINHKYEERRLLVAQSCGELAEFVRPEIRASLILSIIQQLIEDPAAIVRAAAAHNLALLLPLFLNMDKYFKVEELMFQLVCDPSGAVVEASLKKLVPAVVTWGKKLDHVLRVLLSHLLACAQRCPPVSGVEGSVESHLRVIGEKERWNIEVLLRMLIELVPVLHNTAIETCPFTYQSSNESDSRTFFTTELLEKYSREHIEWPSFDWLHVDCFHALIQLACLLSSREDNLRAYISKFLLALSENFGEDYLDGVILPIFLIVTGEDVSTLYLPSRFEARVRGLKPKIVVTERLIKMCVLPLLLTGVLGFHSKQSQLAEYLRSLILRSTIKHGAWTTTTASDLIDAVRFLCMFEEHHGIIVSVLWEMVVSTNANVKVTAASIFKVLVAYVDVKLTSTQILPALITLGSDADLNVKYSSIDAFGAVAQHFKDEAIVDKIRVQMDAFLEDGSHEAAIAVIRSLAVAVPVTTDKLRDYLLHKLLQLSLNTSQGIDLVRRREKANAMCEAIRSLDGTDLAPASVREILLPTIQNLLKDTESLDPAHKEALEFIVKERAGGALETITKVMGSHLNMSSVSNLFGDTGLLGKKEIADDAGSPHAPPEDTRFRRIMRGGFSEIIRGKGKPQEENIHPFSN